jgi:RNA polymerase primary sigma factor
MSSEKVAAIIENVLKEKFLPLEILDSLLEDDASFDKITERLISYPADAYRVGDPQADSSTSNPTQEKMTREEEYRFAKRLEFLRKRLVKTIQSMDFPVKDKETLLRHTSCLGRTHSGRICMLCKEGGPCPKEKLKRNGIQACCRAYNMCRSDFVERNLHLVINFTRAYRTYSIPVMDLVQEGNAALIRAVEKYDWRKQVRLQTYAEFWIRQAVERAISANKWIVRVPNYIQQKMRRFKREGTLPADRSHISTREISRVFDMSREVAGHLLETERGHVSLNAVPSEDAFMSLRDMAVHAPDEVVPQDEFDDLKQKLQDMLSNLTDLEQTIIKHRFGMEGAEQKTLEELGTMMNVSRERIRQIQIRTLQKLKKPKHLKQLKSFL